MYYNFRYNCIEIQILMIINKNEYEIVYQLIR